MRYVHEHLLLGGGELHARSRRVGARNSRPVNQLQQNVFSIGQYPHVLVMVCVWGGGMTSRDKTRAAFLENG